MTMATPHTTDEAWNYVASFNPESAQRRAAADSATGTGPDGVDLPNVTDPRCRQCQRRLQSPTAHEHSEPLMTEPFTGWGLKVCRT